MKKSLLIVLTFAAFVLNSSSKVIATEFSQALKSCASYSQDGSITHEGEIFNILVTLKEKGDKCVYKEKIYQDKNYQMLTCNFDKSQLGFLSESMERYSNLFKKQLAKNKIFEAKMTTNGEVFQKYLVNPKYCVITHSKKQ